MADFSGKFESSRQDWETPSSLFAPLDFRFSFNFDLAASGDNTRCNNFFSEKDNALNKVWQGRCWLNPPYGGSGKNKLERWVRKAHREAIRNDCFVVLLIPARTNTNWWH